MSEDQITEVTTQGFFNRLFGSIIGAILGLLLLIGGIALLWWNEGNLRRERVALSEMQSKLVEADAAAPRADQNGKLIHSIGQITATDTLGDPLYLKAGPFLKLERQVWMYQWVEDEHTKTEKQLGGKETTTKTYTYKKEWKRGRVDSSRFHSSLTHENPQLPVPETEFTVSGAKFGAFDAAPLLRNLTANEALPLNASLLLNPSAVLESDRIVLRHGQGPGDELGDAKVGYMVLKPGQFSMIAVQANPSTLTSYTASNGKEKLLVEPGSHSAPELISEAKHKAGILAWILRAVGFILIWVSFMLMSDPLTTVLDIVPILGSIGRGTLGFLFAIVAFALTAVIVVVSMIAHNPIALIAAAVIVMAAGFTWIKKHLHRRAASVPAAAVSGSTSV